MIGLFKIHPRYRVGMTSNIHLMLLRIKMERASICFKINLYEKMLTDNLVIEFVFYLIDKFELILLDVFS